MIIDIKEVRGKRDLRAFIHLPAKIHVNHHNWIPPIYIDEWNFFNPKKNTAFLHCNTILFLAYNDNKVVGRVMGIINNKYNNKHGENSVRFCFLETFKNEEIVICPACRNYANKEVLEKWLQEKRKCPICKEKLSLVDFPLVILKK